MAKQSINTLKQFFKTGLKPSQSNFWDVLDSFFHKDDKIPITSIEGIQSEFDKYAMKGVDIEISDVVGLTEALENGIGTPGADGISPHFGENGNWFIGTTDTGVKAQGSDGNAGVAGIDGITPHIGGNGNWFIGTTDTGVKAQGADGNAGVAGTDGITPHIGGNGNWFIGTTDTGVKAQGADGNAGAAGTDGIIPHIGGNGNWFIGANDTGVKAQGSDGNAGAAGSNGLNNYQIAVNNGYSGTESQWLKTLNVVGLESNMTTVANGSILLASNCQFYGLSTASNLTISVNTSQADTSKFMRFFLKLVLTDYVALTFPSNFYFANLDSPNLIGEYVYEAISSNSGATWHLSVVYKNVASVGIDSYGNAIIGSTTRFVDGVSGNNSNNGLTWATAFKDVQPAIDASSIGDAVFVKGSATGIKYLPTTLRTAGSARTASFLTKAGVGIFGGFAGTETTLYQRAMNDYVTTLKLPSGNVDLHVSIPVNKSTLSGDLTGTQASAALTVVVNNYSNVILNGFTISGGYNNSDNTHGASAGIRGNSTGINVSNCIIENNVITTINFNGYTDLASAAVGCSLNYCLVQNNTTSGTTHGVGAISTCTVNNSNINSNVLTGAGSMTYSNITGCTVNNCYIYANSSAISAGAICGGTINNCYIKGNSSSAAADKGVGAMYSGTATNCTFSDNSVSSSTAYTAGASGITAYCCMFYNNTSSGISGAMHTVTAVSCNLKNNYAANGVGGAYLSTLINSSVVRNLGGGTNNCAMKNTVVWGNKSIAGTKGNVTNTNSSAEIYCAFEDETRVGTGNISLSATNEGDATSPYFTTISTAAGVVDESLVCTLSYTNTSYLIDKGLNSNNASGYGSVYDIKSNPRSKGTSMDIGSFEYQS